MNRPIVALPQHPEQPEPQGQQAQQAQQALQPQQPAQFQQPAVQPIQQAIQPPAPQPTIQPFAPPDGGVVSGLVATPAWVQTPHPAPPPASSGGQPFAPPDPAAQVPSTGWAPGQSPMPQAGIGAAQPFATPDPAGATAPAGIAPAPAQIPSRTAQHFAAADRAAAQMPSLAWAPGAAPAAVPQAVAQAVQQAVPQAVPRVQANGKSASTSQPAKARGTGVRIGLAQILSWQLALVAVAVAANGPLGVLLGTSAAAVGLVALTAVPVRGAWPHQWAGIATRYLLRRRRAELPESSQANNAEVASALLEPWLGRTTFDATAVRDRPLALVSNQAAVSALLRLDPSGSGVGPALACLLQPDAGLLDTLDEQPADVEIQLVVHAGLRHDSQPRGWIAIAASRTHDLSSDARLTMLVKNAARRVLRHLERAGAAAAQVDDREAATTLVSLAHANAGRGHVRERWTTWSAGPVSQACLRLAGFTKLQPGAAEALIEALAGTAVTASVTVSVSARIAAAQAAQAGPAQPANSVERREPVVRVAAASAGALDVAITVLGRLARAYGVHPERLEGRHGPGVAASLPIARTLV